MTVSCDPAAVAAVAHTTPGAALVKPHCTTAAAPYSSDHSTTVATTALQLYYTYMHVL